ncbi:MAG: iron-containing redox enzyme family protein [Alphaproteobacteria bacterium]|nr:iron-containing redox enzyme family protein [Alphaproteobacteria bacterium]
MSARSVIRRLDAEVDDFCRRTRFFREPMTRGRARMFVMQHRLNSRQRNSVLKLRVATNCPIWDIKIGIIKACAQEIIADDEHGHGKPHWAILEDLGVTIGMSRRAIRRAEPLASTRLAWLAWDALMSNRYWLEGLIANVCAERANTPGYGTGVMKRHGWFGLERHRWRRLFGLTNAQLDFFGIHEAADIAHSNLGWQAVADHAERLGMAERVVEACRVNLTVWEHYLNGIADGGDASGR